MLAPIKEPMKKQGYTDWPTCLSEHIVRLGEIRIAERMGLHQESERLRQLYIQDKKFIYLPHLLETIKRYENDDVSYRTFGDFVPVLIESLKKIDTTKIKN